MLVRNLLRNSGIRALAVSGVVLYVLLSAGAQNSCSANADICVLTQGDSATPQAIPNPVAKANKQQVTIEIGPLSPIESCTVSSLTSTPSATTDQSSLARLIGILLGTTITPPTVPSGPFYTAAYTSKGGKTPASERLDKVDGMITDTRANFTNWIERRQAATTSINKNQQLLTIGARSYVAGAGRSSVKEDLQNWADCLNEEARSCGDKKAVPANDKLKYEDQLQEISSSLAAIADLVKATPNQDDAKRLYDDQATLAKLQNDDTKLRSGEAALTTLFAQVYKVLQHVNAATTHVENEGELFEVLTLVPGKDSDLTGSVTCTSLVDSTTTVGPVPVTIHAGIPHLVFSAGAVISLTPTETLGEVPVKDNSNAGFHTIIAQTGRNGFQVIPFAFETFRFAPWKAKKWDTPGLLGVGLTGGIGYNPYSGVNGVDFFAGGSVRVMDKVYIHVGSHFGRYVRLDPKSSYNISDTIPASGFPATVPTVTRFTGHLAFGASYSF